MLLEFRHTTRLRSIRIFVRTINTILLRTLRVPDWPSTKMDIFLTNRAHVSNTDFCNSDGQVIYKSVTPGSILSANRTTTISKIVPNKSPNDMGKNALSLTV